MYKRQALNTIMSDSLDYAATRLEKLSGGDPEKLHAAVGKLIQEIVEEHLSLIHISGNCVPPRWIFWKQPRPRPCWTPLIACNRNLVYTGG